MVGAGKRAVIYTRVSRDDTGEGASNRRQEEDCRKLCELRGWELVEVCEDISISASARRKRPGWNRVLEMVHADQVDVIVVWAIDRASRNMHDLLGLVELCEAENVGIATVSGDIDLSTTMGQTVALLLGTIARQEVRTKGDRQRRANQQRAAEGKVWASGFRAFGYEQDGAIRESEAELIRQASQDVLDGTPLRGIVRRWAELGLSSPRNAKAGWTHRSVRSILLNPRNAGLVRYKGEVIGRGEWEPIITEQIHTELVARLTAPDRLTRKGGSRGRTAENLLTGIARCAKCGETVQAATGYKGVPVYQCPSYHVSTPRAKADDYVILCFVLTARLSLHNQVLDEPEFGRSAELWAEAERLRTRLTELSRSFAGGAINVEQLEAASAVLNEQLADVERRLEQGVETTASKPEQRRAVIAEFDKASMDEQRAVLADRATITLYPRGRGRRNVPIKEQVEMTLTTTKGRTIPAASDVPAEVKARVQATA